MGDATAAGPGYTLRTTDLDNQIPFYFNLSIWFILKKVNCANVIISKAAFNAISTYVSVDGNMFLK